MSPSSLPALVAIIEDEEHLAQGLLFNLEAEGYRTHHEMDGSAALRWLLESAASDDPPAAIILDVMLPGTDGFAIARALRAAERFIPIMLLTARGRTEDVLEGFAAGADDYLPKPFDLNVLLARLHGLLRRTGWQRKQRTEPMQEGASDRTEASGTSDTALPDSFPAPAAHRASVRIGAHTVDFDALEVRGDTQVIRLTVMEADLLRYLLDRPDRVISRKEILEDVWHVHSDTDTRPIDNFIVRLRRYLEPDPTHPVHLLTVRGVGYRFSPSLSEASLPAAH